MSLSRRSALLSGGAAIALGAVYFYACAPTTRSAGIGAAGDAPSRVYVAPGSYDVLVERLAGDPSYTLNTYALSTVSPPGSGSATRVFCPRFDLDDDYEDAATQADMLEDFGLQDSPDRWRPESMLVRVLDDQGNVRLGWGPLDGVGCTPPVSTPSPTDTTHRVRRRASRTLCHSAKGSPLLSAFSMNAVS